MPDQVFIAIDLGAGSGRVIAARTDLGNLTLEEVHRFENPAIELPTGFYWNVFGLYREILEGLRRAVEKHGDAIVSIGIDTWGCDFGLLDARGEITGMPHQYRDPRFEGMAGVMHGLMPEAEIFGRTGIKTNFYNTSLHLLAELQRKSPGLLHADKLLFIPDLLAYWLTGIKACEKTVASTSQLVDPATGGWAWEVIDALGLPRRIFGPLVEPGTVLGAIRPEVAAFIGATGIPVVATACHDTAAAVTGIPMSRDDLWLSSGTWSIMGIGSDRAITGAKALGYGFCNDFGVAGEIHSLKNIAGLWLIQECRRQWALDGESLGYGEMAKLADEAAPFTAFIDPDDLSFATPGHMPEKIREWCRKTGQTVPESKGGVLRVATDSLALKYRLVFDRFKCVTGRGFASLRAGGGGIQNESLNQATANALGIKVVAGPVEATSCGNVITQMVGMGVLPDFEAGRALISRSFAFRTFEPSAGPEWDAAYLRFKEIIGVP